MDSNWRRATPGTPFLSSMELSFTEEKARTDAMVAGDTLGFIQFSR